MIPMRGAFAVVATVVGLFLLFNFKTPDLTTSRPVAPTPAISQPSPSVSPPVSASGSAAPTQAATPTPASGYRDGTFTGQDFPNDYGDVQVAAVISGGRITDVRTLQMPTDRPRSAYITQQAGPILHDQALQVQSAQIDGVSGATFTSQGYAQSLQSALDQAKA